MKKIINCENTVDPKQNIIFTNTNKFFFFEHTFFGRIIKI